MNSNSPIKIVRAGEGEALWAMGEKLTFKLGADDTNGIFSLAELSAQPRNGPPPHLHRHEDEFFYVLNGEFAFTLGDRTITRSKGFAISLPKGVIHAYNNIGPRPGKMLVLTTPAGFDGFVREWSHPVRTADELPPIPGDADVTKLLAAAPKFGVELRPSAKSWMDVSAPTPDSSYWVLGQFLTLKLTALDTAEQLSANEITCAPGTTVPNHIHVMMDEIFYVLEGTAEFTFGNRVEYVEQGGLVFIPRGAERGFRNLGSEPVKLLGIHTPAGFEGFLHDAAVPAANAPPPLPVHA